MNSTQLHKNFSVGRKIFAVMPSFYPCANRVCQSKQPAEGRTRPETQPQGKVWNLQCFTQNRGTMWFLRHILQHLGISARNLKSFWFIFDENHLYVHLATKIQSHDFRACIWFFITVKSKEGHMEPQHAMQLKRRHCANVKKDKQCVR